jgi:class 3 adenylate cyclase
MVTPANPTTYRFGAFVLDPESKVLRSAEGNEIPLRPRSFLLLQLLVQNAGRLMTREAILSALWPNMFVTADNVTQCVHDVRHALGPGGSGMLRTMNRRGYLFAAGVRAEPLPPRPAVFPEGERVDLSVMVSDIRGFTALSEAYDPAAFARITTTYFKALTDELRDGGATVGNYINDSVMAYWGPNAGPDYASLACGVVLRSRAVTVRLIEEFARRGWPPLPTTFAIHTGRAVVGDVSLSSRAPVGATVNLASRLEVLNKRYGTSILVTETTRLSAGAQFVFRPIDVIMPHGTDVPIPIHELLGVSDPAAPAELRPEDNYLAMAEPWAACISAYRNGLFDVAREALSACGRHSDPVAAVYRSRLAALGRSATPGGLPSAIPV